MASTIATISTPLSRSSPANRRSSGSVPKSFCSAKFPRDPPSLLTGSKKFVSGSPAFAPRVSARRNAGFRTRLSPRAASDHIEEPGTKVKFQKSLNLPGYREKVIAIIGVKVYAAGLYTNPSIFSKLDAWKGRSSTQLEQDSLFFNAFFQAPLEKSLQIVLVRDIDGKTFWDALDEAISPRIASPTSADESAVSMFRGVFQGRPLRKGTFIFLTWLDTEKILVSVSDKIPSSVDATIESSNVTSALFDVFLGGNPVSPSLKASVSKGSAAALK